MSKAGNEDHEADHHPYRRPVDAATLILVDRSGATPKVLVGKRHDKVVFHARQDSSFPAAGSIRPTTASRWQRPFPPNSKRTSSRAAPK